MDHFTTAPVDSRSFEISGIEGVTISFRESTHEIVTLGQIRKDEHTVYQATPCDHSYYDVLSSGRESQVNMITELIMPS